MVSQVHHLKVARLGNQAVESPLEPSDKAAMTAAVARKIEELFDVLEIDHRIDHNTRDTPGRVARMLVDEILRGRYDRLPTITAFDNVAQYDQLIVIGPIELRSTCAHHLMPIYGHAIIGVLPEKNGKIIGLSKYDRIVDHFASRLQIQEELVMQIGRYIEDISKPRGLAVRISAVHMCRTHRGVRTGHEGRMVSSAFFGELDDNADVPGPRASLSLTRVTADRDLCRVAIVIAISAEVFALLFIDESARGRVRYPVAHLDVESSKAAMWKASEKLLGPECAR